MLVLDDILIVVGIVIGVMAAVQGGKKAMAKCSSCSFKGNVSAGIEGQAEDIEVEINP